jgi:hypothetical protein
LDGGKNLTEADLLGQILPNCRIADKPGLG